MILIDNHSRVPIYEQIKEQVIMLINTGTYKPNDKLPSIRSLSCELNINVNTIKRAFAELEDNGVVYSVQGKGVFVSQAPLENRLIVEEAMESIEVAINSGKAKGVTRDELESLICRIYEEGNDND